MDYAAIFGDIHAHLPALEAVFREFEARGLGAGQPIDTSRSLADNGFRGLPRIRRLAEDEIMNDVYPLPSPGLLLQELGSHKRIIHLPRKVRDFSSL